MAEDQTHDSDHSFRQPDPRRDTFRLMDLPRLRDAVRDADALAGRLIDALPDRPNETSDEADIADYVIGAVRAIADDLQWLRDHWDNYLAADRLLQNAAQLNMQAHRTPYGRDRDGWLRRSGKVRASEFAIYASIGAVFDCVAAAIIGIAGIGLSIRRADVRHLLPDGSGNLSAQLTAAISADDDACHEQMKAIRALSAAINAAGPDGWFDWVSEMRNQFLHREHQQQVDLVRGRHGEWRIIHTPQRDPSLTNLQSMRVSREDMSLGRLLEDGTHTIHGVIESTAAAVIGVLVEVDRLWTVRTEAPSLIASPIERMARAAQRPQRFQGYGRDPQRIESRDAVYVNPAEVRRLSAAGLFDKR